MLGNVWGKRQDGGGVLVQGRRRQRVALTASGHDHLPLVWRTSAIIIPASWPTLWLTADFNFSATM